MGRLRKQPVPNRKHGNPERTGSPITGKFLPDRQVPGNL
jgi:hypothetical protein